MRHGRMTFIGAYHHIMNRDLNHENIFETDELKSLYLGILKNQVNLNHIDLFAFCLMDNHFHLILKNSSGRLT